MECQGAKPLSDGAGGVGRSCTELSADTSSDHGAEQISGVGFATLRPEEVGEHRSHSGSRHFAPEGRNEGSDSWNLVDHDDCWPRSESIDISGRALGRESRSREAKKGSFVNDRCHGGNLDGERETRLRALRAWCKQNGVSHSVKQEGAPWRPVRC